MHLVPARVANNEATFKGTPGLKFGSHESVFTALEHGSHVLGIPYPAFEYHGPREAEHVFVAYGVGARTLHEAIARLAPGAGLVVARVLYPWDAARFHAAVPASTTALCVAQMDLFADVAASFTSSGPTLMQGDMGHTPLPRDCMHLLHTAFDVQVPRDVRLASNLTKQIVLWTPAPVAPLGEVLARHLGVQVQSQCCKPVSGDGPMRTEIRFGPLNITSEYTMDGDAHVVAVGDVSALQTHSVLAAARDKGCVVLNCQWSDLDLDRALPSDFKQALVAKALTLYTFDGPAIAARCGVAPEDMVVFLQAAAVFVCPDANFKQVSVHLAPHARTKALAHELHEAQLAATLRKRTLLATANGNGYHHNNHHSENGHAPAANALVPAHLPGLAGAYARSAVEAGLARAVEQLLGAHVTGPVQSLEQAFGGFMAESVQRRQLASEVEKALPLVSSAATRAALDKWLHMGEGGALVPQLLRQEDAAAVSALAREHFVSSTRWIMAHAGPATSAALHQVLKSHERVRLLVIGGDGEAGLYAMSYGGAYVASVAQGHSQTLKAIAEADAFAGPAVLVCSATEHDAEWPLYRWNPALEAQGMDPFSLDSAKLKADVHEFLRRDQALSLMARRLPVTFDESQEACLADKEAVVRQQALEERRRREFNALANGAAGAAGAKALKLTIAYGSDSGHASGVAEALAQRAEASGCSEVRVCEANELKVDELDSMDGPLLLVLATAGQGEDCANAKHFGTALQARKTHLPASLRCAVFGLGDSNYWGKGSADSAKYFCLPARRTQAKLAALGATLLVDKPGLGDDQHDDGFEQELVEWEAKMWKALGIVPKGGSGGPAPHVDDDIKIASNYLRGTIAEGLADLSTGKVVFEDTKILKFHGIYMQDDRDARPALDDKGVERAYSFMIRIGVPGGVATAEQYLAMDEACTQYATGNLKVTTRQAYQFHGIVKKDLKKCMQGINRAAMDTLAACGDVNRNIIATPKVHDALVYRQVNELANAINAHLKPRTAAYHEIWLDKKPVRGHIDHEPLYGPTYLPRKFKVAIAVPPCNDVDVFAHCVGYIAIVNHGSLEGYNVTVGGGLGTTHGNTKTFPRLADVMGFCTPEQAVPVVTAILLVQRDHGERLERKHARLKYTVEDHGVAWFRAKVEEICGFKLQAARPFKFDTNADDYGWRKGALTGLHTYTMYVESGFISGKLKEAMRELARLLVPVQGQITLTANQNVILGGIPDDVKPRIVDVLHRYGVDNAKHSAMRLHSMACVALPTCALAMAEAQRYLPSLIEKLETTLDEVGLRHDAITIRMTGCPNGCARPYMAEIAFIGKAPGVYNLHLGGGHYGNRLNRIYREGVNEEQILEILRPMLRRYAKERMPGEKFGDFVIRAKIIMGVYNGRSFHATREDENDKSGPLGEGVLQIYW